MSKLIPNCYCVGYIPILRWNTVFIMALSLFHKINMYAVLEFKVHVQHRLFLFCFVAHSYTDHAPLMMGCQSVTCTRLNPTDPGGISSDTLIVKT